uniref:Uncharacterized protein n=1 Tax=Rhizophora mucronata TaxID=61149 RepID=A0A2P2PDS1_RHIMU
MLLSMIKMIICGKLKVSHTQHRAKNN